MNLRSQTALPAATSAMPGNFVHLSPRSMGIACAVLILCLGMSLVGWYFTNQLTENNARDRFDGQSAEIDFALGDRIAAYELALRVAWPSCPPLRRLIASNGGST